MDRSFSFSPQASMAASSNFAGSFHHSPTTTTTNSSNPSSTNSNHTDISGNSQSLPNRRQSFYSHHPASPSHQRNPHFSLSPSTSPAPQQSTNELSPHLDGEAFQVIILGSNGGALDRSNSSYLVKSSQTPWKKNCLLAVDAGVLASGVLDILTNQLLLQKEQDTDTLPKTTPAHGKAKKLLNSIYSNLFSTRRAQKQNQSNFASSEKAATSTPNPRHNFIFPPEALPHDRPVDNTWHIVNHLLASVCVTHPHLDHVAGLVINSGNFNIFKPKVVAGLSSTIDSLLSYLFNGVIWPNLTNEGIDPVGMITLTRLQRAKTNHHNIASPDPSLAPKYSRHGLATNLSVLPFEISHGTACQIEGRRRSSVASISSALPGMTAAPPSPTNNPVHPNLAHPSTYISTAYFITDNLTNKTILMWGDVEPDIVSMTPRNLPVWTHAAHLLSNNRLCAIFIECSYNSPHEDALLFGHFSPSHLVRELTVFASMCTNPAMQTLKDFPIIITHIKDEDPLLWTAPLAVDDDDSSVAANEDPSIEHPTGCNIDQGKNSPSHLILAELYSLAKEAGLACTFRPAVPGYSFKF